MAHHSIPNMIVKRYRVTILGVAPGKTNAETYYNLIDNHISIHSLMYTYEGSLSAGCHFSL
jgi:hypothetical protein